eukprot:GHVU01033540.1.p2 GENE.GHVU01033540.1~~GHVU01033540.1.p2  ORF type:complete len:230 (-),score=29.16 GHVU01033540.1:15-704(-)
MSSFLPHGSVLCCRRIQPDQVLNADETFLEYNTTTQRSLAPQGSQHVGSLEHFREKEGITVMVCLNSKDSVLELPMLIFKGEIDANIQKRYRGIEGLHVECNKKHWMNHETMVRWIKFIRRQMWVKGYRRVLLIVDSATQHYHEDVLAYCRETEDTECAIFIRFIGGGLTAIIQPCDVYANKILKSYIRMALDWLRASKRVGVDDSGVPRPSQTGSATKLVVPGLLHTG